LGGYLAMGGYTGQYLMYSHPEENKHQKRKKKKKEKKEKFLHTPKWLTSKKH